MYRGQRFGSWNHSLSQRDTESNWRIREVNPVTTRSGLNTAGPITISSGSEEESDTPPQVKIEPDLFSGSEGEAIEEEMAHNMEEDPEIGSFNAHMNGEPARAIVMTPGQAGIEVKNNVLAVMPHFYGRKIDNPYEFLHEFCKLCGIQRRPAGSSEEDYRLRALPFALKGEADTWFMRLPPNSIRSWAEFRSIFLDYFFPATRTNALKKEIQGATQESDETLSQYWGRFKGLLDACPNNRMSEAEIYNNFYEGLAPESKDLVNSSSGGDFSRLRLSEARRVIGRLIDAKKAYDNSRAQVLRRAPVHAATDQADDRMEVRMDRMEKAILSALERNKPPEPAEKAKAPAGPEERYDCYDPSLEMDYPEQANAAGNWNPGGHWNQQGHWVPGKQRDAPWRDHPNFRWTEPNSNQPPQQSANPRNQEERPSWPSRNNEGQNNWGNRGQINQQNWSSRNQNNQGGQPNWSSGYQPNWSTGNSQYVPPHQQGQQGNQGPGHSFNQGLQGQFHNQQGSFHQQQGTSSTQPPSKQSKNLDDLVGICSTRSRSSLIT